MIMMILMKTVVMRSISLSMWVIDDDRMSWRVSMNWSWIVEWNDNWCEWVELSDYWMIMNMLILVDDYLMNGMKNDVLMIDDNWIWDELWW